MKKRMSAGLATLAVAGSLIGFASTPASAGAGGSAMIQNVATGKCLQGTDNGTSTAHEVTLVSCTRSNTRIWWGVTAGKIMMVRSGGTASQICLSIPKSPSGDIAHDVVTAPCGASGYNQGFSVAVGKNYPIGSPEPCYVGHYSSSDTYASCYVNSGSYTRWNWIS